VFFLFSGWGPKSADRFKVLHYMEGFFPKADVVLGGPFKSLQIKPIMTKS